MAYTLIKSLEQCESGLACETKASDHVSSLTSDADNSRTSALIIYAKGSGSG